MIRFAVSLPQSFLEKLLPLAGQLLSETSSSRRQWEKIIGKLAFACQILPRLKLQFYPLLKLRFLPAHDRDLKSRTPTVLRQLLQDLLDSEVLLTSSPIRGYHPDLTIWTDASRAGWGALSSTQLVTQGKWSPEEEEQHINVLETLAIQKALINLQPLPSTVMIKSDSMVATIAIKKGGSRSPLIHAALIELFQTLDRLGISY